ncbi:MAG TPA: hypothetical protein VET69_15755 [Terriglobales bacterium]|nr:hypothetical protein [Terriglobales bacterium]
MERISLNEYAEATVPVEKAYYSRTQALRIVKRSEELCSKAVTLSKKAERLLETAHQLEQLNTELRDKTQKLRLDTPTSRSIGGGIMPGALRDRSASGNTACRESDNLNAGTEHSRTIPPE